MTTWNASDSIPSFVGRRKQKIENKKRKTKQTEKDRGNGILKTSRSTDPVKSHENKKEGPKKRK